MELTTKDKEYIKNIANTNSISENIVEKNYIEMLNKSKTQEKFKEIINRFKKAQANNTK